MEIQGYNVNYFKDIGFLKEFKDSFRDGYEGDLRMYSPDRKLFWASSRVAMVSTQVILMLAEDACSVKRSAEPRDHNTNLQGSPSTLSCIAR